MRQEESGGNEKVEGEFRAQNALSAEIEYMAEGCDSHEVNYEEFHPYFLSASTTMQWA